MRVALIAVCSAKGSPGVTVAALAFTLTWRRRLLLAECDPAGGDIAAGYLREVPLDGRGLGPLTASLARGRLAQDLWGQLVDLAPAPRTARTRLLLPGLSDPAQALPWVEQPAGGGPTGWAQLAQLLRALETSSGGGYDALVDCGRLCAPGAPTALLAAADAVLLVLRPTLPAVRAAAVALPSLARPGGVPVGLVTVGAGGYSGRDLTAALGAPVVGWLPDDPRTATALSSGGKAHDGRMLRFAARVETEVGRMVAAARAARNGHTRPPVGAPEPVPEARSVR
jgi:hypothetical protein